jgi:hypothetical protein
MHKLLLITLYQGKPVNDEGINLTITPQHLHYSRAGASFALNLEAQQG